MSNLAAALASGRFVVTSEIEPPKGLSLDRVLADVDPLARRVTAFNVTDNQSSVMRLSSWALCLKLLERGVEPILQQTCRDRNRLALQADLLGAYLLGVRNVLALGGDPPHLGDHPTAKPVYDLDSVGLLRALTALHGGKDLAGNPLDGPLAELFPGSVVAPEADDFETEIAKMEKKIEAGARFFQTQTVFNVGQFERFLRRIERFQVPVLVGIILIKSPGMAKFMNEKIPGVHVPDELIGELTAVAKEDRPKKAVEIAARLIRSFRGLAQGVHLFPLGWARYLPQVLDQCGL